MLMLSRPCHCVSPFDSLGCGLFATAYFLAERTAFELSQLWGTANTMLDVSAHGLDTADAFVLASCIEQHQPVRSMSWLNILLNYCKYCVIVIDLQL
jgi:hypothetical protein